MRSSLTKAAAKPGSEDIMNEFFVFASSVGFGSLAWAMLAISDWLLGEKMIREPRNGILCRQRSLHHR
jgi:hypothetical protein